jgi:prolyl 4-hydroxylase
MKYLEQIDDIFTIIECKKLINRAEKIGFEPVDRYEYAKYGRVIIDDEILANNLFKKIKDIIPNTINGMKVKKINNIFRFSKYNIDGEFKLHKDSFNQDRYGNRSAMTLNIFLNENFKGGETDFYLENKKTLRISVIPKSGRGVLFDSQQYHCGNKVLSGFKYLIRTDIMI